MNWGCVIKKSIQNLDQEGTIVMEKTLYVKGGSMKQTKRIFDDLWKK